MAARNPKIKIVTTAWLQDSMSAWKALDENPYLIEVEPDKEHSSAAVPVPVPEEVTGEALSSEDEVNGSEDGASEGEVDPSTGLSPVSYTHLTLPTKRIV